jgi:hypothetical protein
VADDLPSRPPDSAPAGLQALWPLVLEYGISDDAKRDEALESASTEQLTALVAAVNKAAFDLINRYLDDTGDAEEAVPYGDLAQAAMEAQLVLKARRGGGAA